MNRFVLGVDIGGTHITAALVDLVTRKVLHTSITRQPMDANGSLADIMASWSSAMSAAMGEYKTVVTQVGIAMPGPFDYST